MLNQATLSQNQALCGLLGLRPGRGAGMTGLGEVDHVHGTSMVNTSEDAGTLDSSRAWIHLSHLPRNCVHSRWSL